MLAISAIKDRKFVQLAARKKVNHKLTRQQETIMKLNDTILKLKIKYRKIK